MLQGSRVLSEFRTSLLKVLTLWRCLDLGGPCTEKVVKKLGISECWSSARSKNQKVQVLPTLHFNRNNVVKYLGADFVEPRVLSATEHLLVMWIKKSRLQTMPS